MGIGDEEFHYLVLFQAELDVVSLPNNGAGALVEFKAVVVQLVFVDYLTFASGECSDACKQLACDKWLGEVVVSAVVKAVYLVLYLALCGEQEDRGGYFFFSECPEYLESVHTGKHDIQNDAVINAGEGIVEALDAVIGGIDCVHISFKYLGEGVSELHFVLNNQKSHINNLPSVWV